MAGNVSPHGYKVLAPPIYALAVMGRNDCNVAPFLQHTKCSLSCSVRGDHFPGTEEQIVMVQASSAESLFAGVQMIVQTLKEVPPQGMNGEYRLRVIFPQQCAQLVNGRSGEGINQLISSTGVKAVIEPKTYCGAGPEADQLVAFSGALDRIQAAVKSTIQYINQARSYPWWATWLARPNSERVAEASMAGLGMTMGCGLHNMQGVLGMPSMPMPGMLGMGGCMGNMGNMGMSLGNMPMGSMSGTHMAGVGGNNSGAISASNVPAISNATLGESSLEILQSALRMVPSTTYEDPRGFSLRCAVPNRLVQGLLGQDGSVANKVKELTGARIDIPANPNDPDNRAMSITGPLFSTVAAYIYMMKQYLEIEANASKQENGMNANPAELRPLCAQALNQMEQQLTMQLSQVRQMKEQLAALEGATGCIVQAPDPFGGPVS